MYIVSIYGVNTNTGQENVLTHSYAVSWEGTFNDSVVEMILKDYGMRFGETSEYGFKPTHYVYEKAPGYFYHPVN